MAAAGKTSGETFGRSMMTGLAKFSPLVVIGALGAIGKQFHDMSATIRVETGKSGKSLDGLVTSAKNVGKGTVASLEDVGKTVAGINVRLGLTGPVLETLSKQFLAAGRITKQSLDLKTVTGSFNAFNIKGKDTSKALDNLFQISQATGVGINELAAAATKGAPAFRQFGSVVLRLGRPGWCARQGGHQHRQDDHGPDDWSDEVRQGRQEARSGIAGHH